MLLIKTDINSLAAKKRISSIETSSHLGQEGHICRHMFKRDRALCVGLGAMLRFIQAFLASFILVPKTCAGDVSLHELLLATARGATSLAALLAKSKANNKLLSQRDENGFSALAVAAFNGDPESAQLLLDRGAIVQPGELSVGLCFF